MRVSSATVAALAFVGVASCGGAVVDEPVGDDPIPARPQAEAGAPATAHLSGVVTFADGHCEGPKPQKLCEYGPLATDVVLYPLLPKTTHMPEPHGPEIARTRSAGDGRYSLWAPPGTYTLFVYYKGYPMPRISSALGWNPVHLTDGENTENVFADHAIR